MGYGLSATGLSREGNWLWLLGVLGRAIMGASV
jgi:hypothetical protein